MVTKLLDQPLGLGVGNGLQFARLETCGVMMDAGICPQPKLWLGAVLGAGAGLASSIIGGIESSKAAKAAEKRQREQEAKERAWYTRRYNEDYVDTAAGQNLVRRAKDYAREQWRKAAGAQAVGGGTAAASQMAKDAGNKMVGDTIANIAATDQSMKAQVDNMHRNAENQFAQMDIARENQRAQNISNAAQQASNAIMQAGLAAEGGGATRGAAQQGNNNGTSLVGANNGGVSLGDYAMRTDAEKAMEAMRTTPVPFV